MQVRLTEGSSLYITRETGVRYTAVITPSDSDVDSLDPEMDSNTLFAKRASTDLWYMLRWYSTGRKSMRLVDPHVEQGAFLKGMFRLIEESSAPQILMSSFGAKPSDWAEYSRVHSSRPEEIEVVPLPRNARQVMFDGVSQDGKQRLVVMNSTFYPYDETSYRAYLGSSFLGELPRFDFQEPACGESFNDGESVVFTMATGQRLELPLTYSRGFSATLDSMQFSIAGSVPVQYEEGITSLRMCRNF